MHSTEELNFYYGNPDAAFLMADLLILKPLNFSFRDKENIQPNKSSVNGQFKVPFKKKTSSPEKLFDDPEQYFASIINSET